MTITWTAGLGRGWGFGDEIMGKEWGWDNNLLSPPHRRGH